MTFEKLVEKIAKRDKAFGKESNPNEETLCIAQKGHKSKEEFAKDENRNRGRGRGQRGTYRGRGEDLIKERNNVIDVEKLVILPVIVELTRRKMLTRKSPKQDKGNDKGNHPKSSHYVVAHCNLGIEEAFSTSFSLNGIWLLDTGATCHMTV